MRAGVAEPGQRRRIAFDTSSDVHASGAYPVGVRGFESHPPHHYGKNYGGFVLATFQVVSSIFFVEISCVH